MYVTNPPIHLDDSSMTHAVNTNSAHPLRFCKLENTGGVSSRFGSKLPLPLYADVRLHISVTHRNDVIRYTFKTLLDGYDLTPRLIPGEAPPAPHRVASFADDVNSRAYTELNYLNYAGSLAPVELGEWRDFTLTVVPTDVAGNVAADGGVPFMWTIDMRAAITSITTAPEQLSSDSANIRFAWLSDEDGTTRKLTYQCAVDGGAPYECSRSGEDGGRGEYTIPQLPPPPPSGPYDPSKPAEAHNFTVLSVDEAGNAEQGVRLFDPSNPYTSFNAYSWLVDSRAPVATFTSPNEPAAYVSELEYAFRFESDENGGSFQCTLASAFPDGSSSTRVIQYETLGNGQYTLNTYPYRHLVNPRTGATALLQQPPPHTHTHTNTPSVSTMSQSRSQATTAVLC